jgi:hypothetical protein
MDQLNLITMFICMGLLVYCVCLLLKFDKARQELAKEDPVKAFWVNDTFEEDPWQNRNKRYWTWIWTGVGLSVISFYLYGRQDSAFNDVFGFTVICLASYNILLLKPTKANNEKVIPERIKALDKLANLIGGHCAGFAIFSAILFIFSLI